MNSKVFSQNIFSFLNAKKNIFVIIILCFFLNNVQSQSYKIIINPVDSFAKKYKEKYLKNNLICKDSATTQNCFNKIINDAKKLGYYGASIDKTTKENDSTFIVDFFAGEPLQNIYIKIKDDDLIYIDALVKNNKININPIYWDTLANNILLKLADNGYAFAEAQLKDFMYDEQALPTATLEIKKSIKYKIDSIVTTDTVNIVSKNFLYKYLGYNNNTYFNNSLLKNIKEKINKLPYLSLASEPNLQLLNSGGYIILDLKNKNANSINALLGLVPANNSNATQTPGQIPNNKYSVIGQANVKLWNILGSGEYMALQFEQLIPKHPKLIIETKIPYVLKSNFPALFNFNLYRRDTLFLNVAASLSTSVTTNKNNLLTFGLQWAQTNTVGVNLNTLLQTKQLPNYIDSRFYGLLVQYDIRKIDNIFYPRGLGDISILLNAGSRIVKKNNEIVKLKDPNNPNFNFEKLYDTVAQNAPQIKWNAIAQKYIALPKLKVLKCAIKVGALVTNKVFFNEQFLLGGIKSIRGFDEESQPASLYSIGSLDYRIPAGSKAYFAVFSDAAWVRNSTLNTAKSILYGSFGAGLAIKNKNGTLNISIANGAKTGDPFNAKRTKVHLAYDVNF